MAQTNIVGMLNFAHDNILHIASVFTRRVPIYECPNFLMRREQWSDILVPNESTAFTISSTSFTPFQRLQFHVPGC